MCFPAAPAAIQAGLQAAQTVAGFVQQSRQVDAQNEFAAANSRAAVEAAERAAGRQTRSVRRRQIESRQRAASEVQAISKEALEQAGLARVSAAVGGVSGASVGDLLSDFAQQEQRGRLSVTRRQAFEDASLLDEAGAVRAQLRGRLRAARFIPIAQPSFLNAAIKIGAGSLAAFGQNTTTIDGETVFKGF